MSWCTRAESGASSYSASKVARARIPGHDRQVIQHVLVVRGMPLRLHQFDVGTLAVAPLHGNAHQHQARAGIGRIDPQCSAGQLSLARDHPRRTRATPASARRLSAPTVASWPRLTGEAMRGVLVPAWPHTWRQTPLRPPARTRIGSSSIDDEPRARERTMGSRALRRRPPRAQKEAAARSEGGRRAGSRIRPRSSYGTTSMIRRNSCAWSARFC